MDGGRFGVCVGKVPELFLEWKGSLVKGSVVKIPRSALAVIAPFVLETGGLATFL